MTDQPNNSHLKRIRLRWQNGSVEITEECWLIDADNAPFDVQWDG